MNRFLSLFALLSVLAYLLPGYEVSAAAEEGGDLLDPSMLDRLDLQHRRKLLLASTKEVIPDQYIVVLTPNVTQVKSKAQFLLRGSTARLGLVFHHALQAFVVSGLAQAILMRLLVDSEVAYVAQDSVVSLNAVDMNPPSWGLDRVDQVSLPLDNKYQYWYTGAGVEAYILDTGIRPTHSDLKDANGVSRVTCGFNFFAATESCTDLHGHGTHVAGTVGGLTYGIAKQVRLITVKVLNQKGSGSSTGVLAGLDYVANRKRSATSQPMVINMSLGANANSVVNDAVNNLAALGVVVSVSAGNNNADACSYSPSSATNALTVGATTNTDGRAAYSNYGPCVDLFAPGSNIMSCSINSDTASIGMSGTSMASPHVAGAAALVLGRFKTMTPDKVRNILLGAAAKNKINSALPTNTVNLLLQIPTMSSPAPSASPSRKPVSAPSAKPTILTTRWESLAPSAAICPPKDFCKGRDSYWVHRRVKGAACRLICVPITKIDQYVAKGYQCGRCQK